MKVSNTTKVALYIGNIHSAFENDWSRDAAYTIQSLNYTLYKDRDSRGVVSEITQRTKIEFMIKTPKASQVKNLYKKMRDEGNLYASIVFNPDYDEYNNLRGYSSSIVVDGLFCNMREKYTSLDDMSDSRTMFMGTLKVDSITFTPDSAATNSANLSRLKLNII